MVNKYHDNEYQNLVQYVLEHGVEKTDRTGTGTTSVFAYQMRFDLSGNSIPLLTTKKMHTRSIIHEILWYLQGNTSSDELERNGVSIWKEWKDDRGNIGPLYGRMWRSFPPSTEYVPVPIRHITDNTSPTNWECVSIPETLPGKHSGTVGYNQDGMKYEVIGIDGSVTNGNGLLTNTYAVRFVDSGWIKRGVRSHDIKRGRFRDQSVPTVYGVGKLGDYTNKHENDLNKKLRRLWEEMISRCYNTKHRSYSIYGGRGVTVCNRWLTLSSFIEDVKNLPNWFEFKYGGNYTLDKDYYGDSKLYHPDTCAWVLKKHNNQHQRRSCPVEVSNEQNRFFFPTSQAAASFLSCSASTVLDATHQKEGKRIGDFTVCKFESNDFVIRAATHVDQIASVIHSLRHRPDDRRMIISAWSPSLLPLPSISPSQNATLGYQSLPPCHSFVQFWSVELSQEERKDIMCQRYPTIDPDRTGYFDVDALLHQYNIPKRGLKCHLYQRSCDVGLGVPFNIVQYSILTHMIAHVTDHVATEFIWTGGDVHIYNNHRDQLREQLNRSPYPSPTLNINPDVTDIDSFKFRDLEIVGYDKYHPPIKMEVAV